MSISADRLRELLSYDRDTGVFEWIRPTNARIKAGAQPACTDTGGYVVIRIDGELHRAHRLAWLYVHGSFPSGPIDHRNGDRADNRIANIRAASGEVNAQNRRVARNDNKLGILGVCKSRGKFLATITAFGRRHHLGYFPTAELASASYLSAKRRLHEGCTI